MPFDTADQDRALRLARTPNLLRLEGFVLQCLDQARTHDRPRAFLQANAAFVRAKLQALSAWAAKDDGAPCPPELTGLTAFDLAEAADRLESEAAPLPTIPPASAPFVADFGCGPGVDPEAGANTVAAVTIPGSLPRRPSHPRR